MIYHSNKMDDKLCSLTHHNLAMPYEHSTVNTGDIISVTLNNQDQALTLNQLTTNTY